VNEADEEEALPFRDGGAAVQEAAAVREEVALPRRPHDVHERHGARPLELRA
jgi:hypothetical protein